MKTFITLLFCITFIGIYGQSHAQVQVQTNDVKCTPIAAFSITLPSGTNTGGTVVLPANLIVEQLTSTSSQVTLNPVTQGAGSSSNNQFSYTVSGPTTAQQVIQFFVMTHQDFDFKNNSAVTGLRVKLNTIDIGIPFTVYANATLTTTIRSVVQEGGTFDHPNQTLAHVGSTVTRTYTISNTNLFNFTGVIRFSNQYNTTALERTGLTYSIKNNPAAIYVNPIAVTLNQGEQVFITETFIVRGCIGNGEGISTARVEWGCDETHIRTELPIFPSIGRDGFNPILNYTYVERDLTCYGSDSPVQKSMVIKNEGIVPAHNVQVRINNDYRSPISIVNNSIKVSVNGAPPIDATFNTNKTCWNGDDVCPSIYDKDLIVRPVNINLKPLGDVNTLYIVSALINTISGVPISLNPNDELKITWSEVNTCYKKNFNSEHIICDISAIIDYKNECGTNLNNTLIRKHINFSATQSLGVFNPYMEGDPNKFRYDYDGQIQTLTVKNTSFDLPPSYLTAESAEVVYQVLLADGLDLDLSLEGRAINPAYTAPYYKIVVKNPSGVLTLPDVQIQNLEEIPSFKNVYEIRIPVSNLQTLFDNRPQPSPYTSLNQFISELSIEIDVRCYCAGPLSPFQIDFAYRYNCTGGNICPPELQNLSRLEHHLYSTDGTINVLCPGCITPGATILYTYVNGIPATHFIRRSDYVGLADDNNDGAPDGTSTATKADRRVATDGDIMENVIRVGYSDGSNVNHGFNKAVLTSKHIYVKHLYIDVTFPFANLADNMAITGQVSATIVSNGIATTVILQPEDYITIGQTHRFRIHNNFDFNTMSEDGYVELHVNYKLGHLNGSIQNYSINYNAKFSDCGDCNGFGGSNFSIDAINFCQGRDAEGKDCFSDEYPGINMSYLCEAGGNNFQYIPWRNINEYGIQNSTTSICEKNIQATISGQVYLDPQKVAPNGFVNEYRNFLVNDPVVWVSLPIPAGYRITKATIINTDGTGVSHNVYQQVAITPELYNNATGTLNVQLRYTAKTAAQSGQFGSTDNVNFNPDTDKLILGDDGFASTLSLQLTPITCSGAQSYFSLQQTSSTIVYPVTLPGQTSNSVSAARNEPNFYTLPVTNLVGSLPNGSIENGSTYPFITNRITVPVQINNIAPLTGTAINPDPSHAILTSQDALNSFLAIQLPNSSVSIVNVTRKSTGDLLPVHKYGNSYVVELGTIKANTVDNAESNYLITLEYNCSTGCDPFVDCITGGQPAGCLNNNQVIVDYGWNCNGYPTSTDLAGICENERLRFSISSAPVGVQLKDYLIKDGVGVELTGNPSDVYIAPCSTYTYKMTLGSCKKGAVKSYLVNMTVSSNLSNFTLSNLAALQSQNICVKPVSPMGPYTHSFLVERSGSFAQVGFAETSFDFLFNFTTACDFINANIISSINVSSFCGIVKENELGHIVIPRDNTPAPTNLDNMADLFGTPTSITVTFDGPIDNTGNILRITIPAGYREKTTLNTGTITRTLATTTTIPPPIVIDIESNPAFSGTCATRITATLEQHYIRTCSTNSCDISPQVRQRKTYDINPTTITLTSEPDPVQCGCFKLTATDPYKISTQFELKNNVGNPSVFVTPDVNGKYVFSVCPTATTTYSIKYRCLTSNSVTADPNASSHLTVTAYATAIPNNCNKYSLSFSTYSILPGNVTSYSWTPTTGLDNPLSATPIATVTANSDITYKATVTYNANNGKVCTANSSVKPVYHMPAVSAGADLSICNGGGANITAVNNTTYSSSFFYQWTPSTGINGSTTTLPIIVSPTSSTNYRITIIDGFGCSNYDEVLVKVAPFNNNFGLSRIYNCTPLPNITPAQYSATLSLGAPLPGATFQWQMLSGGIYINLDNSANINTPNEYKATVAGTYRLKLVLSGCTLYSLPVNVNSLSIPIVSATASNANPVCPMEQVNLSATVSGGVTPFAYLWVSYNQAVFTNPNALNTGAHIDQSGDVYFYATDANYCQFMASVPVNIKPATITIGGLGTVCLGSYNYPAYGAAGTVNWYEVIKSGSYSSSSTNGNTKTYTFNSKNLGLQMYLYAKDPTGACGYKYIEQSCMVIRMADSSEVDLTKHSEHLLIYPNPSEGIVTFEYPGENQESILLEITDANGVSVYKDDTFNKGLSHHLTLPLASGVYYVKTIDGNEVQYQKMIITR